MKIRFLLLFTFISLMFFSCMPIKALRFNYSDYHSKPKFKSHLIENDSSNVFDFYQKGKEFQDEIGNYTGLFKIGKDKHLKTTLDSFLSQYSETTAFIVIRNDTILYEKYFHGYERKSLLPSFSISKSFTSALIGIALEEGYIKSVDDPIINYIPELEGKLNYWNRLTIAHLLDMKSGIEYQNFIDGFKDFKLPYFGDGDMYFSKNAMKVIKSAKYSHPPKSPGTEFNYSSLDNQLLGLVLERAVNRSLSEYLGEKIWKKIGMQKNARWGIDSKRRQVTKSYCCMDVTALDYARFGRLYLKSGDWNGTSVVPKDWVRQSLVPISSKTFTRIREVKGFYQNQWWVNLIYNSTHIDSLSAYQNLEFPEHQLIEKIFESWHIFDVSFIAEGAFGQYVYVDPRSNLIFIRLGKDYDHTNSRNLFKMIKDKLAMRK